MIYPTYANLGSHTDPAQPRVMVTSGPISLYGDPRHYKCLWQVFSPESPYEGDEFFERAPRLCCAAFEPEVARLVAQGMSCLVYGVRLPRRDPANPWKLDHPKWQGREFAPSWDEDTDPIVHGGYK